MSCYKKVNVFNFMKENNEVNKSNNMGDNAGNDADDNGDSEGQQSQL